MSFSSTVDEKLCNITKDMTFTDTNGNYDQHGHFMHLANEYKLAGNKKMQEHYEEAAKNCALKEGGAVQTLVGMQYLNKKFAKLQLELQFSEFDQAILASQELQEFVNKMEHPGHQKAFIGLETNITAHANKKRHGSKVTFADAMSPPQLKRSKPAPSSAGHTPYPKKSDLGKIMESDGDETEQEEPASQA